ncbi:glycosyltransferase family 4 protein [Pseudoluteimonas lycopersici]|uniref:Glycosyltransferase family 4 protein n=1 Tax=Pseudoluteimonas lycopersici TaxID=1324796 RepID=A0A516V7M7_9GAMM|nr:glycosyltransferase [Lysobacter lycopersici]QDQ74511.1 glycosyltransferase family 4 protein [Lysobacter lycopersici]
MPDARRPGAADARPRLLVLASTYPRWPGDPEPGFVHELAKRLADRFRVIALVPHAPGAKRRECMDGVDVVRYRYAPRRMETLVNDGGIVTNLRRAKWKLLLVPAFVLAQAWATWRLLRRERIDVVHAHWLLPQGLVAALLQSLPGRKVPFVVTSHGADLYALRGKALDALKRFVVARAASVTVVSSAMLDRLAAIGADAGKVSVLSMGVDLAQRFAPDPSVPRSDRELLFVGRLVEKKGLRHLLDAMPAVLRAHPDARLVVAGFGPEEGALREQARSLGLEHAVRFLGAVPQAELPSLYRRAALFVAPFVRAESGDEEGLGLVLVEAIGCGCPVVVGNVAAMGEVFGAELPTVAVDARDAQALAARIGAALDDPDARRDSAERLRATVVGRFGWERVADAYAGLLSRARGAA